MSVPAPRKPRHGGRQDPVTAALGSWPRTFQLCLIRLVTYGSPAVAVVVELLRHVR